MIYGPGVLDSGMAVDLGVMIADNEIAGLIENVLRGIPVDDYEMDYEGFLEEGIAGSYLYSEKTLDYARNVYSKPKYVQRSNVGTWKANGCPSMTELCAQEARRIVETEEPDMLPEDVAGEIRELILKYEKDNGIETPEDVVYPKRMHGAE